MSTPVIICGDIDLSDETKQCIADLIAERTLRVNHLHLVDACCVEVDGAVVFAHPAVSWDGEVATAEGYFAATANGLERVVGTSIALLDPCDPRCCPCSEAELQLVKAVTSAGPYAAGDTITGTFVVTNTGDLPISGIVVADTVAGVTVTNPTVGSLEPGESNMSATWSYVVTQDDIDSGSWINTATATGTDANGEPVSDDSSTVANPTGDDPTVIDFTPLDSQMQLAKTITAAPAAPVEAGDLLTYTFTVTNTGTSTLQGITITDPVLGLVNEPVTPDPLAPGLSGTVVIQHAITQAEVDAGEVVNTATASAVDLLGEPVSDISDDPTDPTNVDPEGDGEGDDPTVFPITSAPAISSTKVITAPANPSSVMAGQAITYTFTVTNDGNTTLSGLTWEDALLGVAAGTPIPGAPASLAPGASHMWQANYTVTAADIMSGSLTNQATVTGQDPNGTVVTDLSDDTADPTGDDDPTVATFEQPAIGLVKTADSSALSNPPQAGDTITYTLTVTNTGDVQLTGVTVSDPLLGLTNAAVTPSTLAVGATGTATATYQLTQADIDAGQVQNTATTQGTSPAGTVVTDTSDDSSNLPGQDDPTVTPVTRAPAIELIKEDISNPAPTAVGDTITYAFTVTNTGNTTLSGLTWEDALLGVAAGTPIPGAPASLAPGASHMWQATYTTTTADFAAGSVANSATATGTDPAGANVSDASDDPADLTGDDDPTVTLLSAPGLQIVKETTSSGPYGIGDTISGIYSVTNTGNEPLSNITIVDTNAIVAGSPIAGPLAVGATDTSVTWSHIVTQAEVDAGSHTNQATATGTGDLSGQTATDQSSTTANPSGDDPNVIVVEQNPAIALVKTADTSALQDPPQVGDIITYTFAATNTGDVTLSSPTVTDAALGVAGLLLTPAPIAPGATASATATYALTPADIAVGSVTNSATVTAQDPQGGNVSDTSGATINDDDPTVTVLDFLNLALAKTAIGADAQGNTLPAGQFEEGGTVTWQITVTNDAASTMNATGVIVSDVLPGAAPYVSHTATQGAFVPGTGVWTIGTLAPGAVAQLDVLADLPFGTADTTIDNTATISAVNEAQATTADDSDTASIDVVCNMCAQQTIERVLSAPAGNLTVEEWFNLPFNNPSAPPAQHSADLTTFLSSTDAEGVPSPAAAPNLTSSIPEYQYDDADNSGTVGLVKISGYVNFATATTIVARSVPQQDFHRAYLVPCAGGPVQQLFDGRTSQSPADPDLFSPSIAPGAYYLVVYMYDFDAVSGFTNVQFDPGTGFQNAVPGGTFTGCNGTTETFDVIDCGTGFVRVDNGAPYTFNPATDTITAGPTTVVDPNCSTQVPPGPAKVGTGTEVLFAKAEDPNVSIDASAFFSGATSYSATGLPAGLSINPASGQITGTSPFNTTTTVTITATNAQGSTDCTLQFVVDTCPPSSIMDETFNGFVGQPVPTAPGAGNGSFWTEAPGTVQFLNYAGSPGLLNVPWFTLGGGFNGSNNGFLRIDPLTVTAGDEYTMCFRAGRDNGPGGIRVDYRENGGPWQTALPAFTPADHNPPGSSVNHRGWGVYEHTFTATGSNVEYRFIATSNTNNGNDMGVNDICFFPTDGVNQPFSGAAAPAFSGDAAANALWTTALGSNHSVVAGQAINDQLIMAVLSDVVPLDGDVTGTLVIDPALDHTAAALSFPASWTVVDNGDGTYDWTIPSGTDEPFGGAGGWSFQVTSNGDLLAPAGTPAGVYPITLTIDTADTDAGNNTAVATVTVN